MKEFDLDSFPAIERVYGLPEIQLFYLDDIWEIHGLEKENLILKKLSDSSYSEVLPITEFFNAVGKALAGGNSEKTNS